MITFMRSRGDYDFFSPVVNLMGNGAVYAVGATAISTAVYLALKALGASKTAAVMAACLPAVVAVLGAVAAIVSCIFLFTCVHLFATQLRF